MMDNDIIPINQLPDDDVIPLHQLPNDTSENFLQKAISSNRTFGNLPITGIGMLPMNRPEMMDVGKATVSANIPSTNMGPVSWGMSMADKRSPDLPIPGMDQFRQAMAPQTQYGKNLQFAEQAAPLAMLGAQGVKKFGSPAVRGIKNLFSTKPFVQEKINSPSQTAGEITRATEELGTKIKGIESEYGTSPYIPNEGKIGKEVKLRQDLTNQQRKISQKYGSDIALRKEAVRGLSSEQSNALKTARQDVQRSANELAYTGKEEANQALKTKLKSFHEMYDERLAEIGDEAVTKAELAERLRNASSNMSLGGRRVLTGDEQTLKGLANEIHPPKMKGESISKYTARGNTKLKANDIKAFMKNTRSRMSSTDHPLTEVYKEVGDLISEKMPEYSALKEEYKPIYDTIKQTKKLFSEGGVRSLTTKTVSPTKFSQAESLEKDLGINITGRAKDIASRRGEISKQFGLKTADLREVKDAQLNEIYNKLSQSKESQSRMIHEMRGKIEDLKTKHASRIEGMKGYEESRKTFLENEISKRNWRKAVAGAIGSFLVGGKGIQSLLNKKSKEY